MYGSSLYGATMFGDIPDEAFSATISDGITVSDSLIIQAVAIIAELVRAQLTQTSTAELSNALSDNVAARDFAIRVLAELIAEHVTAAEAVTAIYESLPRIMEALMVTENLTSVLEAKNAIVSTILAADRIFRVFPVTIADAAELQESLRASMVLAIQLVDQALAQDTVVDVLNVTCVIPEALTVTDTVAHLLEAFNTIRDGVVAIMSLEIDGNVYTGVVINTETGAVSEYADWPFNSFSDEYDGQYFGIASDGIYLLEGDTDDGDDIQSYVRTGLLNLAGGIAARVPSAYFGYTATGDLVLKVTTTQKDFTKKEYWYRLEKRAGNAPTSTRVKIGRGLKSVLWQFELHSVDGSQFGLNLIKLAPMILERRV